MGLSFHCPQCSQAVPALPTQMGQQVSCPACKAQFRLSPVLLGGNGQALPAGAGAQAILQSPAAPPVAASAHASVSAAPKPPRQLDPPPRVAAPPQISPPLRPPTPSPAASKAASPPVPPARPNVARFIAAVSQDSAVQLTQDGKLPELSLAEATAKKPRPAESNTSPLLLGLVLAGSTLASILLLVVDFGSGSASTMSVREARQSIQSHYANHEGPLLPYQALLRDSQRAYQRRDRQTERELYHRVLALLRDESIKDGYGGLTGTKRSDDELKRQLGILLGAKGER